ncbi:tetratricopeptide repeat protein [Aquifex aeolicus]|uniref:Ancillary SecYEG translocon subunit/Cell division coordinator CpoB TPR domain-containing protein n=1 Tax=Aquifex aeolicus (strain VF5) TaxID=224324 RepID=O67290_AQUAE|nr:tol-pal system YbgF family protein [Aquifex aeolicus]AAC07252.1 putative protein [Aquifex aeolicus VF5]
MKKYSILLLPFILASCAPVSESQFTEQRLSELEIKVAKLEERQEKIEEQLEEINKRLDYITKSIAKREIKSYKEPEEEKPPFEEVKSTEDEKAEYENALELYKMKQLNEARDAFVEFIKKYPNSKYTDNAYFWLGKTFYELGNTERAKQIFNVLIKKCKSGELPDCNKLPDTYFMLVKISLDEGNIEEANRYLSILEEKFPDAEATQRAKELIYKTP